MRVVLDTNVLVSAILFPRSLIGRLPAMAASHAFDLFLSPAILDELHRVLGSRKIGFSPTQAHHAVLAIREIATVVRPKRRVRVVTANDDDNRILECVDTAHAAVLVTGDLRHLRPIGRFKQSAILTPREFLDRYFPRIALRKGAARTA